MGGRGASSGISKSGKKYGTEYTAILKSGNIKFVRYNDSKSSKPPMETMTKGRVYVTVGTDRNGNDVLKTITYYNLENKKSKQIDIDHYHNKKKPHVHEGYEHEGKTRGTLNEEQAMVERVEKLWYNYKARKR